MLKHEGRWLYYEETEFELMCRPGVLPEAFRLAMKELVGATWASKIVLRIDVGGAYGEADEGAERISLRLAYEVRFPSSFPPLHYPSLHFTDAGCSRRPFTCSRSPSAQGVALTRGAAVRMRRGASR